MQSRLQPHVTTQWLAMLTGASSELTGVWADRRLPETGFDSVVRQACSLQHLIPPATLCSLHVTCMARAGVQTCPLEPTQGGWQAPLRGVAGSIS